MPRIILRSLLIIFALTFVPAYARAQQIQGQVRYSDAQPAANVTVRCDGSGGNTIQMTDASGKFFFRVSPGSYTVTVRVPGYVEEQRSVDLLGGESGEYMLFKLRPDDPVKALPAPGMTKVVDASVPAEARKEFEKGLDSLAGGKKGGIEKGVAHLEMAVRLYPNFLEALLRLGAAYMDLRRWDEAEQAFDRALKIGPKTANAYFALGEIYLQRTNYAEAERTIRRGLEIENRSWRGHFTLARVYWGENDIAPAGRQTALAIQLKPDFAEAHLLAGNILARAGKREDALTEFQEYLRLAPKGEYATQARQMVQNLKQPANK